MDGSPSRIRGLTVVDFGRVSRWVGELCWSRLHSLQEGVIGSDFGWTSGVGIFLSKICFLSCSFVLPIVRLQLNLLCPAQISPTLVPGTFPLSGTLMTRSSQMLCLSLHSFNHFSRKVREGILGYGSSAGQVSLMLALTIVLFKLPPRFISRGKSFGELRLRAVSLSLLGQRLEVKISPAIT